MKLNLIQKTLPKPLVTEASDSSVTKNMVKAIVADAQKLGINAKQFSQHFPNVLGVMQTVGLTPEMVYEHLGFGKTDTKSLTSTLEKIRVYGKSMADFMKDCSSRGVGPRRIKNGFPDARAALEAAKIDPFEAYEALGLYNDTAKEAPQERKIRNYLYDRTILDAGYGSGQSLFDSIQRGLSSGRSEHLKADLPKIWPKTTAAVQQDGYTWEDLISTVLQMREGPGKIRI